ncbi:MAG: SUMF1/EgtB/PvdO family nonheme iron enzyme [Candidatus Riflebacteria bacterium]|nr:SUMF1/EgtB/PvdO family nonheme iron enzyme [Candidatus Riflebacteria bacterium]
MMKTPSISSFCFTQISFSRFLFLVTLIGTIVVTVIGCSQSGSETTTASPNPVGVRSTTPVISGNVVDFGKTFSGLDSIGIQVEISNVPANFDCSVFLKTASGSEKKLEKASIPSNGLILAYNGLDLFETAPFRSLTFSKPIPEGAVVTIRDANSTFSNLHLSPINRRTRMDLNNDGIIGTSDLAFVISWLQTGRSNDLSLIYNRALEIYPSLSGQIATPPSVLKEDLNGDSIVDTSDVAIAMAWIQVGRISSPTLILNRAREIYPLVTGTVVCFPGDIIPNTDPSALEIDVGAGVKMDFVQIQPGTFGMGDDNPAQSIHDVTITKSFWLGTYEVTQAQYFQVTGGSNPSHFKPALNHPVENVSWNSAVQFCNLLSDQQKLSRCYTFVGSGTFCDFSANGFRLPTEAEWEYSCGTGLHTAYYWGEIFESAYAWSSWGNCTHDVGMKLPNVWGLYDMSGNVSEWCNDWYDFHYYENCPPNDPQGPASGSYRIFRGGSYWSGGYRTAERQSYSPGVTSSEVGFRVCRTAN